MKPIEKKHAAPPKPKKSEELPEEFESDYDYDSAESSEESSESEHIRLSSDQRKVENDTFLAEFREALGEGNVPNFEAKEIVASTDRLNKYVADRKRSYNTYDDDGNRIFVKKVSHTSFVKETRWNERCVMTTYVEEDEGWWRTEDRKPLSWYELFSKQKNCVVFTHHEE